MGGSTAGTPASPEFFRASDAERDHAVSELRNEFAEGRLSHETFMYRMQSALDARNRGQLAGLFSDLPSRRPGLLARIRAALQGPAARDRRQAENPGIPGTQRTVGSRARARAARRWPGFSATRAITGVPSCRRPVPPRTRLPSSSRPAAGSGSPSGGPATATCA